MERNYFANYFEFENNFSPYKLRCLESIIETPLQLNTHCVYDWDGQGETLGIVQVVQSNEVFVTMPEHVLNSVFSDGECPF